MEILPLHIEYLLTRHDCVIVPGFGAFIATGRDARLDAESGVIIPRSREISFNGSVVTDDGLLSHSIARRERLSYEDAHRLLSSLTEKMKSDLEAEGEFSIGMVGRLLLDAEGLVTFEPRKAACSDLRADIRIRPVETAEEHTEVTTAADQDIETAYSEDEDREMRTIIVPADRYVFSISKRAVHAAAMFVMILTIGLSLLMPINHDNEQKASVISIEEIFRQVGSEAGSGKRSEAIKVEENDSTFVNESVENH